MIGIIREDLKKLKKSSDYSLDWKFCHEKFQIVAKHSEFWGILIQYYSSSRHSALRVISGTNRNFEKQKERPIPPFGNENSIGEGPESKW